MLLQLLKSRTVLFALFLAVLSILQGYVNLLPLSPLAWIYENGVDQTATQTALDGMIESQINPTVVTPALPWTA